MDQIRVRLRGGPEDGREITVPADTSGHPVPRITGPVRGPEPPRAAAAPPLLIYERAEPGRADTWEFDYVGAQSQT